MEKKPWKINLIQSYTFDANQSQSIEQNMANSNFKKTLQDELSARNLSLVSETPMFSPSDVNINATASRINEISYMVIPNN